MQLGSKGWVKAIYTWRNVHDFVQVFVTRDTGTTHVVKDGIDFGTFSNQLYKNSNDGERKYQGLQFQMGYRPTQRWALEGHYTIQLKNDGNQEGEGTNTPGAPSWFSGFYPEAFNEARTYPVGRLDDFQRHRVRLWTTYDLSLGRIGDLNAGLLFRGDSGTAYSLRSTGRPLTSIQAGILEQYYPDAPANQPVFYSVGRGSELYNGSNLFDLALTYSVKTVRTVRPWVKVELRNLFSSTPLISYNTTVTPDSKSPKDDLGLPTGFVKGSSFGKGTSTANYPFPREFLVSMGIRF
jgi:hypothetical protein